jgi:hypothetical protein
MEWLDKLLRSRAGRCPSIIAQSKVGSSQAVPSSCVYFDPLGVINIHPAEHMLSAEERRQANPVASKQNFSVLAPAIMLFQIPRIRASPNCHRRSSFVGPSPFV